MYDRIPTPGREGRVLITPEDGSPAFYATVAMADNPLLAGTPLSKETLLRDDTAARFGMGQDAVPDDVLALLSHAAYDNVGDIRVTRRTDLGDEWLPCDGAELHPDTYPELTPQLEPVSNTVFFDEEFSHQYTGSLNRSALLFENGREMFLLGDDTGNYIVHRGAGEKEWTVSPAPAAVSSSVVRWIGDRYVFINDSDYINVSNNTTTIWVSADLLSWEAVTVTVEGLYVSSSNTYRFYPRDIVCGDGHYMLALKRDGNLDSGDARPLVIGFSSALEGPYDLGDKNYSTAASNAVTLSFLNGYFFFSVKASGGGLYSVSAAAPTHDAVVRVDLPTEIENAYAFSPVLYVADRYWLGLGSELFTFTEVGGEVTPLKVSANPYSYSLSYDAGSGLLVAASQNSSSSSLHGIKMAVFDPVAMKEVFAYLNKAEDTKYVASVRHDLGNPLVMLVNTSASVKTLTIRRYRGYESRHIPLLTFDEVSAYIKAKRRDTFAGNY